VKITCGKCQAVYSIDDSLLQIGGIKAQCPACGDIQVIRAAAEAAASAAASVPPALPPPLPRTTPPPAEPGLLDDPFDNLLNLGAAPPPAAPARSAAQAAPASSASLDPFHEIPDLSDSLPPARPTGQDLSELISSATAAASRTPAALAPMPELPDLELKDEPVAAPTTRCGRCGGRLTGAPNPSGLCERCQKLASLEGQEGEAEREWRVQTTTGVILGPLTLQEVRQKYRQNEITAADKVARGEGELRLISSYPEFAMFFRRPGDAFHPVFRRPPASGGLKIALIVLGVLVLGGGALTYLQWPRIRAWLGPSEKATTVVEDILDSFGTEIPNPTGSAVDAIKRGRELMLRDERLTYLEADRAFKGAVLLDPANPEAIAGWVQNRALLDRGSPNVNARKTALDLVDYALERSPNLAVLLRAKAFLLFSLGRSKDAQDIATSLMAGPGQPDPEVQLVLGATYIETNTELAVDLLKKSQAGSPGLNLASHLLGEAHVRLARFRAALDFFDARLQKDPGQVDALVAVADLYLATGKFEKAREVLESILAAEPTRTSTAISLARVQYQALGDLKAARALLEAALKSADKLDGTERAALLAEHCTVLRLLGQPGPARQAAEEALRLDPSNQLAQYGRAASAQDAGDLAAALGMLRALREPMSDSPELLGRLAEAEAQIPDFDTAVRLLNQAIERSPQPFEPILMLASLYLDLDNPVQAFAVLRKLTRLDPFYGRNHLALVEIYEGPNLLRQATERAQRAAAKNGEDALALSLCGIVMWRAGQPDKARSLLSQAIGQDEESFPANLYLGLLLQTEGQQRRAVEYLEKAHEADALNPIASQLLASAYAEMGKLPKAEALLHTVLKADPGDLAARLRLAELLLARHKREAAIEELRRVYEGDNDNVRVKQLLFDLGY
jgi:predicted Zn finger-like uncharacterized protein